MSLPLEGKWMRVYKSLQRAASPSSCHIHTSPGKGPEAGPGKPILIPVPRDCAQGCAREAGAVLCPQCCVRCGHSRCQALPYRVDPESRVLGTGALGLVPGFCGFKVPQSLVSPGPLSRSLCSLFFPSAHLSLAERH